MLHQKLENGIELAIKESHFSRMVAIQCWIEAGSLHELPSQYGMAHVLEHMLFKGTKKRGVGEISRLVESYGGDINAYTTFDHTVFYLTLSSDHWQEGVDILADAVFNSTFDKDELVKEKEVILEEIRQGNDSPSNALGRKVFEEIYNGTDAARPIIGSAESVSSFSRDDLIEFYKRWYQPNNMKVIICGDVDSQQALDEVKLKFAAPMSSHDFSMKPDINPKTPTGIPVHLIEGDYNQPRIEIAFPGPGQEDPDQVDLDLAAFALGAGDSARLNKILRDNQGLVSSVGCSQYSPEFGGVFGVSAIPEPTKIIETIESLAEQLGALKSITPVTGDELSRAIVNLRADQLYQEETVNGQARSLGYSLSTQHKTLFDAVYAVKVENASSDTVAYALENWLDSESAVIVAVVPKGVNVDPENIRDAYRKGFKKSQQSKTKTGMIASSDQLTKLDNEPKCFEIKPGLKLVYRQNEGPSLFNLVAVTEGGLRGEGDLLGIHNSFANLLTCGTEEFSYEEIVQEVESRGSVLAGFSGKDSLGIKLQCFSDHIKPMGRIWRDCLTKARFPLRQWEITKLEIQDDIRGEQDSPANIAVRRFQEVIFGKHPYRSPLYGEFDKLKSLEVSQIESQFNSFRDGGPWVIGAVGSLPEGEVRELCESLFSEWSPSQNKRKVSNWDASSPERQYIGIDQDKEQTHLVIGSKGLSWDDADRYALDVLSTILGGSGGRFFVNLRDKMSLAYTVTPMLTYGCHPGGFGAYLACAPQKLEESQKALEGEFEKIRSFRPSDDELTRAQNYLVGSHESEMQRGDSQAMTMALMEAYGIGFRDFLNYSHCIRNVTPADILRVANRILDPNRLVTVAVGQGL